MLRKKLFWQTYPVYLLITALFLVAIMVSKTINDVFLKLTFIFLVIVALSVGIFLFVVTCITKPLALMREAAKKHAQGDLNVRVPRFSTDELAGLAESMNQMAEQLNERIQKVSEQHLEKEHILTSMVEGVVVLDGWGRVLSLNSSACKMLSIDEIQVKGKSLIEFVRHTTLIDFIRHVMEEKVTVEIEITVKGQKILQVTGTSLKPGKKKELGMLLVFNDITRLKKLETVRRDFVANVSHELKTPLTSIRGFVETLREGDSLSPEERQKFLKIISEQTQRLHDIIEDLMKLSRVERDADVGTIELRTVHLKTVILAAVAQCENQWRQRSAIHVKCPDDLHVALNKNLMEQAVNNLLDNAVKYSEAGQDIEVSAFRKDAGVKIIVKDCGRGIPQESLPRIFERFFRVDPARAREEGGSGLGLSIVRHIVQAHGGAVSAESELGKGSTFCIMLPHQ